MLWFCQFSQFSRVQLCDPMDCSMPGFPVLHQLPELAQTHVPQFGDTSQPSHPLSLPSPAFNLSQHQGPFQWASSLHLVAKVLEFQLQHQSLPMNIQDWFPLGLTGLISLQTLKSLLQHCNSKASVLWHSAFFMVLLSHPYVTTGKNYRFD